uniref:Uncharacterized protein n=1 Tax=Kalanchoe fedtschenkoi TaxID=63787 RepID=A0A7N0TUW2_KALFE
MAVSFTSFSWWAWSSKEKEKVSSSNSSSNSPVSEWGLSMRESESIKFRSVNVARMASTRRVKRKWPSREERERRVDREYDAVMVPSDGTCLSGSESDDSDWSIGWLEPHGADFLTEDDEMDNTFAVLVPCYRSGCKEVAEGPNVQFLSAIKAFSNDYAAESKKLMEQWLSSLEN